MITTLFLPTNLADVCRIDHLGWKIKSDVSIQFYISVGLESLKVLLEHTARHPHPIWSLTPSTVPPTSHYGDFVACLARYKFAVVDVVKDVEEIITILNNCIGLAYQDADIHWKSTVRFPIPLISSDARRACYLPLLVGVAGQVEVATVKRPTSPLRITLWSTLFRYVGLPPEISTLVVPYLTGYDDAVFVQVLLSARLCPAFCTLDLQLRTEISNPKSINLLKIVISRDKLYLSGYKQFCDMVWGIFQVIETPTIETRHAIIGIQPKVPDCVNSQSTRCLKYLKSPADKTLSAAQQQTVLPLFHHHHRILALPKSMRTPERIEEAYRHDPLLTCIELYILDYHVMKGLDSDLFIRLYQIDEQILRNTWYKMIMIHLCTHGFTKDLLVTLKGKVKKYKKEHFKSGGAWTSESLAMSISADQY